MEFQNKIMLITYADSMGTNLKDLKHVIDTYYDKAVGGVHILPFFPSSASWTPSSAPGTTWPPSAATAT